MQHLPHQQRSNEPIIMSCISAPKIAHIRRPATTDDAPHQQAAEAGRTVVARKAPLRNRLDRLHFDHLCQIFRYLHIDDLLSVAQISERLFDVAQEVAGKGACVGHNVHIDLDRNRGPRIGYLDHCARFHVAHVRKLKISF